MKTILHCFNFQKKYYCGFILIIIFTIVLYFSPGLFIAIGDILNKYSEAIIALSAILGVLFGSSWLDTSKKKMKGKLDYDIARKYLKSIFKLRDAMKIVRNPFIPVGEMQSALEKNGFKGNEYEDKEKVNRSVYSLRWNNVQDVWTSFEEVLVEAEISWGEEAINIQKDLDKLVRELRSIVWLFVNYPHSFHEQYEKNSKLLYGSYDREDDFSVKVDVEINKIRDFLKQYL